MNASLLNVSHRNNNITLNNNIYYNYDYLSRRIRESEPLPWWCRSPVVITLHGRFSRGWYFCFEAREFLETGDEAARLAGNAPFIIDKDSGEIHSLGTAKPLEEYLQDYEIKKATFGLPWQNSPLPTKRAANLSTPPLNHPPSAGRMRRTTHRPAQP